ncbi:MAG: cation:proton antiporter [Lentisphaerae bacterium]|nr:cation:proton antiporter [Lentisphaerota bacterium]
MNPAAIEGYLRLVMTQWLVIIAVAYAFGRLAHVIRQPKAVGEIAAGILLGPSALGAIWPEGMAWLFPVATQPTMQVLAKIGVILLMFQVGMEFDFGHLRSRSRTVTAVALLGLVVPMLGGLLIGPWLHRTFLPDVNRLGFIFFLCIALAISALPIMGRILLELKLERTPLGALAISAAAIDDVVGWILLAVATAVVTANFSWLNLLGQVAGVAALFCFLMYLVGPLKRRLWTYLNPNADQAVLTPDYLALVLIALLATCLTTNRLGVFSIFGAFLMGVALHKEVTLVREWRVKFQDFVMVALVPIFFVNTGLRTELGSLTTGTAWLGFALVMLMAVGGKLGGCFLGARLTGQSWRDAACIGALMNTRALMGLVAINVGLELKLLNKELFTMLVLMALLTTAMTGPLLRLCLPRDLRALADDGPPPRARPKEKGT